MDETGRGICYQFDLLFKQEKQVKNEEIGVGKTFQVVEGVHI